MNSYKNPETSSQVTSHSFFVNSVKTFFLKVKPKMLTLNDELYRHYQERYDEMMRLCTLDVSNVGKLSMDKKEREQNILAAKDIYLSFQREPNTFAQFFILKYKLAMLEQDDPEKEIVDLTSILDRNWSKSDYSKNLQNNLNPYDFLNLEMLYRIEQSKTSAKIKKLDKKIKMTGFIALLLLENKEETIAIDALERLRNSSEVLLRLGPNLDQDFYIYYFDIALSKNYVPTTGYQTFKSGEKLTLEFVFNDEFTHFIKKYISDSDRKIIVRKVEELLAKVNNPQLAEKENDKNPVAVKLK